jgi:hypothetical protein
MLVMFLNGVAIMCCRCVNDVLVMCWLCFGDTLGMCWEVLEMFWLFCIRDLVKSWLCVGGGICSFALFAVAQDAKPRTFTVACVVWTLAMSSSMVVG